MPLHPPLSQDELIFRIAFSKIKGINLRNATRLINQLGSVDGYFTLSPTAVASVTGIDARLCSNDYRQQLLAAARKEADFVTNNKITPLFFTAHDYPTRLLECDDAPPLLFQTGNCSLNALHVVSIVGTRHATPYGIDFVKNLIHELSQSLDGLLVISGLAYGIDISAHRAALDNDVPTAAVVAHGLNTIYPADHRNTAAKMVNHGGAIVTEYTSDSSIHRGNFLARNRLVAGLADAVIVVESDIKGGALITARFASDYSREVFAVPGRVTDTYSRGCNELIANHTATVVRSAQDLISTLQWSAKPQAMSQQTIKFELTPEQRSIADYITAHPDHTVNDICVGLSLPYHQLSAMLFEMEMSDMILSLPGGRFSVKNV